MKASLYRIDTYYNAIKLTAKLVSGKSKSLNAPIMVFAPEKSTLMLETEITTLTGGYFNTRVFSFGKFLKYFGSPCKVLSKEASVMAVRKILGEIEGLECFKAYQTGIAQNIYDSIALLKSAKVTPDDLSVALNSTDGVLKNKLKDLKNLYIEYENYLNTGYTDQSGLLSEIPDILDKMDSLKNTDVFLVGFDSWTAQARTIVEKLLLKAKSVTAVLVGGENEGVYTNETPEAFVNACAKHNITITTGQDIYKPSAETAAVLSRVYSEKAFNMPSAPSDKIKLYEAKSLREEIERVAGIIKSNVINGDRYRDHGVAISDASVYYDVIEKVFAEFGVPYYIDLKKKFSSHPLACLIIDYIEALRKNYSRETVINLIKNPIFCPDKELSDRFENYVIKYNIKFNKFLEPFKFKENGFEEIEAIRNKLASVYFIDKRLSCYDFTNRIENFLTVIDAEATLRDLASRLSEYDPQEAEYSVQAFDVLNAVFSSIKEIMSNSVMDIREYKSLLSTGFSASEISILPQRNDSVYIGGYRDVGGAVRKHLFAIGLNGSVPEVKQDIAVLSDKEISILSDIKVIIEPKVKAVNSREREIFVTALTTFTDTLYLSYSVEGRDGKSQKKSDALSYLERIFNLTATDVGYDFDLTPANKAKKYLSKGQAEKQFAREAGLFKEKILTDFSGASAYYYATEELSENDNGDGVGNARKILDSVNADMAERLSGGNNITVKDSVSVSTLENFYSCPFKCFMDNGVKLYEREDGEIRPKDSGNFIHTVVERYALEFTKGAVTDINSSDVVTEKIVCELCEEEDYKRFNSDAMNSNVLNRLKDEAKRVTKSLYAQLTNTSFKILGAEVEFGFKDSHYRPITLNGKNGGVKVRGKVDRIDKFDNYFRVIDYKTGSAKLSDEELFMGKKLQLYLYLNAFTDEGSPAGSYYYKISDDYISGEEPVQLDGKTVADANLIFASDTTLNVGDSSKIINAKYELDKEGKLKIGRSKSLITEDEIVARMIYAKLLSEKGVDYIKDGFITATPYEDNGKAVCSYCPYGAVCGYEDGISGTARKVYKSDGDVIQQAVNSVTSHNGVGLTAEDEHNE